MMPALDYRIDYKGFSMVFSGDAQEEVAGVTGLARGCELLIHVQGVPEHQVADSHLLTKPSVTGTIARNDGCRLLVLTHILPEIEKELDAALGTVREVYEGEVLVAKDRMSVQIDDLPTE